MVNVNKLQQGKVMGKVKIGSTGLPVYLLPYLAKACPSERLSTKECDTVSSYFSCCYLYILAHHVGSNRFWM